MDKVRNGPWFLCNMNLFVLNSLIPSVLCTVSIVKRHPVGWYWHSGEGEENVGKRSHLLLSNIAQQCTAQHYSLILKGNDKHIELSLDFS